VEYEGYHKGAPELKFDRFRKGVQDYEDKLFPDPTIHFHPTAPYNTLLEQNLLRNVEPYSNLVVDIEYVAQQVGQGRQAVETKLSQMIRDNIFHGVLDQEHGRLLVFDEPEADCNFPCLTLIRHLS